MPRWTLSHYGALFPGRDGELLVCNSFMGALARIAPEHGPAVLAAARDGLDHADGTGAPPPPFDMLCDHGYFVPEGLEEVSLVSALLERERDRAGQELIVMPHENCNFRCTYCYESFERGLMRPPIVEGLKQLVRRKAAEWGRLHISWFGGEPLLARRTLLDISDDVIETCAREGIRYSSAMTTNGYYLTPDLAGELLRREVRFFQVTLDGPMHEHDARRHLAKGGSSYRRVLDNLAAMRMRDPEERFTVRIRVNFDPDSFASIQSWFAEIGPIFAGDARFQLAFHPIGRWGGPNDEELAVCGEEEAWRGALTLAERSMRHGFGPATFRAFLSAHGSTCYAGRAGSMVIGSDGAVYKCTVAFDDPRNQVGRLGPDGILAIDEAKWRRWVTTDGLETGKCGACWFNAACQSRACPLVAMERHEPPCPTHAEEMRGIIDMAAYGARLAPEESSLPAP